MSKHKHRDHRRQPESLEPDAPAVEKTDDSPAPAAPTIGEPPAMPMLPLYPIF